MVRLCLTINPIRLTDRMKFEERRDDIEEHVPGTRTIVVPSIMVAAQRSL